MAKLGGEVIYEICLRTIHSPNRAREKESESDEQYGELECGLVRLIIYQKSTRIGRIANPSHFPQTAGMFGREKYAFQSGLWKLAPARDILARSRTSKRRILMTGGRSLRLFPLNLF